MSRGAFAKIYRSLWDGTLGPRWQGWSLFVYMLANCDAEGVLDVTPESIAARCGMPLDEVLRGLEVLESEDPRSRTTHEGGRRIVRLDEHRDWGWRIVNFRKYRDSAGEEDPRMVSARVKRWRERQHVVTAGNGAKRSVRQADREAEAEEPTPTPPPPSPAAVAPLRLGGLDSQGHARLSGEHPRFAAWYSRYPLHKARRAAAKAYAAAIRRGVEVGDLDRGAERYAAECRDEDRAAALIKHPATWLNGDCWLDEHGGGRSGSGGKSGAAGGPAGVSPGAMFTTEEMTPPTEAEKARVREIVAGLNSKIGGAR